MNHIYRLIWNTALGCWMVASEHTKGRGKRASGARAVVATAALVLSLPVMAADVLTAEDPDGPSRFAVVPETIASPFAAQGIAQRAVAGVLSVHNQLSITSDSSYRNATLSGDHSIVLGSRSSVSGGYTTGYGNQVVVNGSQSSAFGFGAKAGGIGSTALGANAQAWGASYALAVGTSSSATGRADVAIGNAATASGTYSNAIGYAAATTGANGVAIGTLTKGAASGAVSLGNRAEVATAAADSVALGSNSSATAANTVSVGNATLKRKIVNVADGTLNAASAEAVTGKQLFATDQKATTATTTANTATAAAGTATTTANAAMAKLTATQIVLGDGAAATGTRSTAVGVRSTASGRLNAIALGTDAKASGDSSSVAIGTETHADHSYAVAIGHRAKVTGSTSTAMGYEALAAGAGATAIGRSAGASADYSMALGHNAKANAASSVAIGHGSVAAVANTVSVGSASQQRKIVNVADGTLNAASTEAVTGKQLFATDQKAATATTTANAATAAAATASTIANAAMAKFTSPQVAMGKDSVAAGAATLALGNEANASKAYATAMGYQAKASESYSNAVGYQANASGSSSVAIGSLAAAASQHSLAFGDRAGVAATSAAGIALGREAKVQANAGKAVALGTESIATVANTVSVGNAALKRKIVNVGDGLVAAGSSEAVTGNQLNTTNTNVTAATNTANTAKSDAANALTQVGAVGGLIRQTAANANVRIGAENTGTIIDVRNKNDAGRKLSGVADGVLSGTSTEAVTGKQLHTTNTNVTAASNKATAAQTTAAAAATAANKAQIGADLANSLVSQVSATGNMRLGAQNTGRTLDVRNQGNLTRTLSGVTDGALSATSTDAVTGKQLHATDGKVTAADNKAVAAQTTATAAATAANKAQTGADLANSLVSQISATGNVRLGAQNTGRTLDVRNQGNLTRTLSGVTDGALSATSTDAVTGKQLHATDGKVTAADNKAVAAQTTADKAGSDAATALTRLASAKTILGIDTVAAGSNANAMGARANAAGSHSNAIGYQASTAGANAVGVGTLANAAAEEAIAMGNRAIVDAASKGGIALGAGAKVEATAGNSIALGAGSVANAADTVSVGTASKQRRIVNVGNGTVAANSRDAVTGGQLFTTNEAIKSQQTVVADNTRLIGANRVSIDGNQTAIGDNRAAIDGNRTDIDGNRGSIATLRTDLDVATADLDYAVMFNKERTIVDLGNARISGLAAGDISRADSRDAVNGGQLFATNARVGELEEQRMFVKVGYDDESVEARAGLFGIALGDSAEASVDTEGAVALGSFAVARSRDSVALGRAAYVHAGAEQGFALGPYSHVEVAGGLALGATSAVTASARNSVALGYGSIATEANTISVGSDTRQRRVVNMARGVIDSDATTVAQLKGALDGLGGGATVDATGAITAPAYVLSSSTYNNVGDALLALDSAVVTAKSDVDTLGSQVNRLFQEEASARADGAGRLALGGAHGMVLGNVADGRIAAGSRDAVNGGQLHATNQKVGENRSEISDLRAALDGMQPRAERSLMAEGGPVVDFGGSRLAGVGAGDISSANSKDAVNGGQLFATNSRVAYLEEQQKYAVVGTDELSELARAGLLGVAIGDSAEASMTTEGGTAIGSFAKARGRNSVALGRSAAVSNDAEDAFALGGRSAVHVARGVALGAVTIVEAAATNSVALGYGSVASEPNIVSLGSASNKRRIVNVANGTADHDAATVGQLKRIATVFGGSVDANGNPVTPSFNVQGGQYRTVGDALTALDTSVEDNEKSLASLDRSFNRLFQEDPTTRTDGPGRLNLGGAHGMVLGNVANGLIAAGSRDAVNGGQLYEVQKNLQGQIDTLEGRGTEPVAMMSRMGAPVAMSGDAPVATSDTAPAPAPVETPVAKVDTPEPVVKAEGDNAVAVGSDGKERSIRHVAKGTADTDAVNVSQLNDVLDRANEYTDLAVEGLNKRLDGMDKRFNRMAAMSSAQSAMAMNTAGLNTYNRLGAGVGHSDGESALAVGYQRVMNERGSATFSLNGAFTNSGEKTVGVGVGIGW